MTNYSVETLDEYDDDGTMVNNVEALKENVVGRRIVSAGYEMVTDWLGGEVEAFHITLDDGRKVALADSSDCCAYTELKAFLLNPELVDHVITGVGTTDGFSTWHIFADAGDVLALTVGWSCGNPFYYGYGFDILVTDPLT